MPHIINLALDADSQVVAQFLNYEDALEFCARKNLFLLPFNVKNGEGAPVPPVGTVDNG